MTKTDLLEWLRGKITDAESTLKAREQMEETWRSGDDKSWAAAAAMHPSTSGKPPMKMADRIKVADGQRRIAVKCRRELKMFEAALAAVQADGETVLEYLEQKP